MALDPEEHCIEWGPVKDGEVMLSLTKDQISLIARWLFRQEFSGMDVKTAAALMQEIERAQPVER